jgi:uncharacterized protein
MNHEIIGTTPNGLAVVTGATAGIGRDFARELAGKGLDVLIIGRRQQRLQDLKTELEDRHGVSVYPLQLDLSVDGVEDTIVARIEQIGLPLKWLVNNAGYQLNGLFEDQNLADLDKFTRVMLTSPVVLTHKLIPVLKTSAPSFIVNVGSLASFLPGTPGSVLYCPTKAYLKSFTEVLAGELADHSVTATLSCPGLTQTEIFDNEDAVAFAKMKAMKGMPSTVVVKQAIKAAEEGKIIIVHGWSSKLLSYLVRVLPLSWSRALIELSYGLDAG